MSNNFDIIKPTDENGRINLGSQYANMTFEKIIKDDGSIILRPIKLIKVPLREAWLYNNKKAHKMLITGIKAAKEGKLHKDPTESSDYSWLDAEED